MIKLKVWKCWTKPQFIILIYGHIIGQIQFHIRNSVIFSRETLKMSNYVTLIIVQRTKTRMNRSEFPQRQTGWAVNRPGFYLPDWNCKEKHYVIKWFRSESLRNRTDFETGYHFMIRNTVFRLANSPLRLYQNNHG